jgi:hypothetical protein
VELVVSRLLRRYGEPSDAPAPRQPASLWNAREHEGTVDARDAAAVAVATIARGRRRRVDAVEARSAPHHAARLATVHAQRLGSRDIALRREHVRQLRDARAHGAFRLVAHFFFFLFFVRSKLRALFELSFIFLFRSPNGRTPKKIKKTKTKPHKRKKEKEKIKRKNRKKEKEKTKKKEKEKIKKEKNAVQLY